MVIDVDSIKDMISRETKPKKVYKYGIDEMIADRECVKISKTGSNYEFYIVVGKGSPQRCTPNSIIRCKEHGTIYTNLLKLTGQACPNAILYVIDYNVHEIKFDITEKRTITLNNSGLPIDVDYCAKGTVTFTYKHTFENGEASILSYLNEGEYDVNDKLYKDIQDIIKNALEAFAKENGNNGIGFDDEKMAYQFYNDKKNVSYEKSRSLNEDIKKYQQSDYIINRSDIEITIQVPDLDEHVKSEGEKNLAASATMADQDRQQAVDMNEQKNAQELAEDQLTHKNKMDKIQNDHSRNEQKANAQTDADIAVISAEGDAKSREIALSVQKSEYEQLVKEKYEQFHIDALYAQLNQMSDESNIKLELMKMQLENQFKQESQKTDVITGLLSVMSQQQLISDDSIKHIIEFCNGLLKKE